MLSYDLASLRIDAPIGEITPDMYRTPDGQNPAVLAFFERMEFWSLLPEGTRPSTDWSSLGVETEDMTTPDQLASLMKRIHTSSKIGLATW